MSDDASEVDRIERELTDTRERLDGTIDALQEKLSPGELVSQATAYFKDGSGMELSHTIGRSLRENPMPLALIGVGLGWLILSGRRPASEAFAAHSGYPAADDGMPDDGMALHPAYQAAAYHDLATKAVEAGAGVTREADESDELFQDRVSSAQAVVLGLTRDAGEAASAFAQRVNDAVTTARDGVQQIGRQAGRLAGNARQAAADMAGHLLESGQAGMRSLQDYGQAAADEARGGAADALAHSRELGTRTATFVQDRPLLLGALGVALGAGLGLLIPASRSERRMLGEAGAGLREQAEEALRDVGTRAAQVAQSVLDTAHDAAQRAGLNDISPAGLTESARELVSDTAGKVRSVVEETTAAGRQALERELAPNDDASKSDDDRTTEADPAAADQHTNKKFEPV